MSTGKTALGMALAALTASLSFGGCADNKPTFQDAGPIDAAIDAPVDAAVDAPTPLPAYEITGGAQKVTGSRFAADVQIGHGLEQAPASGNGKQIEGNAAVKP
jgi:hypothetical protein